LVDELPDDVVFSRTGPRPDRKFLEGLQLAVANPGTWAELGHFQSEGGAKNMDKKVASHELDDFIPNGNWQFDSRRVHPWDGPARDADTGKPIRWSVFYGKYLGEDEDEDLDEPG